MGSTVLLTIDNQTYTFPNGFLSQIIGIKLGKVNLLINSAMVTSMAIFGSL